MREKIFDLAQRLSFFEKPLPGAVGQTTGQRSLKTLTYRYADVHRSFSYHQAESPAIRQLTALFEKISTTLEFGRRLGYLQRHNKEALSPELRLFSSAAQQGSLLEVQAIAPTLRDISSDDAVTPAVRQQANALLAKYGSVGTQTQS